MNRTRAYFVVDENAYVGYSDVKELWNGFATPCFIKKIANIIVKDYLMDGEFFNCHYDKKTDSYVIEDLTLDEGDDNITECKGRDIIVKGKTLHVYDIGSWEWVWSRHTLNELKNTDWFDGIVYK